MINLSFPRDSFEDSVMNLSFECQNPIGSCVYHELTTIRIKNNIWELLQQNRRISVNNDLNLHLNLQIYI